MPDPATTQPVTESAGFWATVTTIALAVVAMVGRMIGQWLNLRDTYARSQISSLGETIGHLAGEVRLLREESAKKDARIVALEAENTEIKTQNRDQQAQIDAVKASVPPTPGPTTPTPTKGL